MTVKSAAILLAGGQARRMGGGDKNLIMLAGKPVLQHVLDRVDFETRPLMINANGDPSRYAEYGLPVCADVIDGYAGPLAALTGAQVYTSAAEAEHAKWLYALTGEDFGNLLSETYHRYGLPVDTVNAARTDGSRYRRNTAALPELRLLEAGDEIKTSAGSWRIRTDKGHSDAQISLMDRERGLFLSVDFLLPRISPNISADIRDPDSDLLSAYFTYLKEMTELPADMQIFPGHDWPFRNGGVRAQQLIDHHNHRLDLLSAAAQKAPLTVWSAMDVLFGRTFGNHEMYFASGEARAHLNYLVAVGRLHKRCDDLGTDIYEAQDVVSV